MEKYEKVEKIGEGTYGVVYKGRNKESGQTIALKKITLDEAEEGVPCTTIREIALLKVESHAEHLQAKNPFQEREKMYLVPCCCAAHKPIPIFFAFLQRRRSSSTTTSSG